MEQYSQYLMWVKSRNSWEEEAFAEDSRGPLGGFVWPPRSYSCSFCRREFRSAQALGGHMNIHRRERAKLKQSLNATPQHNPNKPLLDSANPSNFFSSLDSPSRVSSVPVLGQEISITTTLGSTSDTKSSCVCDQVLVFGTNLYLGFDRCDDEEVMNCKRQKTMVSQLVMKDQVDLELRLAR